MSSSGGVDDPATPAADAPEPSVEAEVRVAEEIRQAILSGAYAPNQRLIEADLSEQYNASRFVLRTALQELAHDGLVEMQRNRGARVRAVPLDEALEIVEVRMVLEGLAAARASQRASAEDIDLLQNIGRRMRRAVEASELMAYSELNAQLHSEIQRISGNATCTRTLNRLRSQAVRHQFALSLQPGRPQLSVGQHEKIIASIADADPVAAEQAMREHLQSVIEAMKAMPTSPRLLT